jgi:hypothetical protein
MSRTLSLTARSHGQAAQPEDVEVVLMQFDHDDLDAPIRISSDPTERLSTEPLRYGTRSSWNGTDPQAAPFYFLAAGFELPGDQEDAPAAVRIVLDLFDATLVTLLRSVSTQGTAHLAIVFAASPDTVEIEFRDLRITTVEYGEQLVITCSRRPIEEEGVPAIRMTKDRFPGLFP